MTWNVFRENINRKEIVEYNIFAHSGFANEVDELLKEDVSRDEFDEKLRMILFYYFGSKAEYEVVITSWVPHIDRAELDRLNTEYEKHNQQWGYYPHALSVEPDVGRKVDIYNQVMINWDRFRDYLWSKYRLEHNIISQI